MKMSIILSKARGLIKKVGFQINKHSPEILMVTGISLGVTAGVVACKQTRKANNIVDVAEEQVVQLTNMSEVDGEVIDDKTKKHIIAKVKASTALNVSKAYAPAVIIGAAGIACIICSNQIMKKRIAMLATAYAALDTSFREYRQRVVEQYGEDADKNLYFGTTTEEIATSTVDENGNETETKVAAEKVTVTPNDTTVIFGPGNQYYNLDPTYNRALINSTMAYMNSELGLTGHMFLNEGLRRLGFDETKIGQVIGWVDGDIIQLNMKELDNPDHEIAIEFQGAHYILNTLKEGE